LNKPLNGSDSRPRPVQVQGSSLVLLARLKVAMGLNLPRRAWVRTEGVDRNCIGAYVHLFFNNGRGRTAVVWRVACYFGASLLPSCTLFSERIMHFIVGLDGRLHAQRKGMRTTVLPPPTRCVGTCYRQAYN